jgi:hypothetical protein
MNILLVYPENKNNRRSLLDRLSSYLFKSNSENINLIEISVHLPIIWHEKLIDLNFEKLNTKDILWADHVIVCATQAQKASAIEVIQQCKNAKKKIILTGNAVQEGDAAFAYIDHLVANAPGFEEFSNDLANNSLQKTYDTIPMRTGNFAFSAYSLWGIVGKFTRAIQGHPA